MRGTDTRRWEEGEFYFPFIFFVFLMNVLTNIHELHLFIYASKDWLAQKLWAICILYISVLKKKKKSGSINS